MTEPTPEGAARADEFVMAIKVGDADRVRAMMAAGADVNAVGTLTRQTPFGPMPGMPYLPLSLAAARGDCRMIELLLDAGADVNAAYEYGYTAVWHAARDGHLDAVKLLAARGGRTDIRDTDGRTLESTLRGMDRKPGDVIAFLRAANKAGTGAGRASGPAA